MEGCQQRHGAYDGFEPRAKWSGIVGKRVGTDGEAQGISSGLAEGVANFGAEAIGVGAGSGGGLAEGEALNVINAKVMNVVVGESVAAATYNDTAGSIPGDQTRGGESMPGEPDCHDRGGGGGLVEDVFYWGSGEIHVLMVLRSDMRIESVDLFYLSMPEVLDIGDGSQDALLVRVRAGEWTGWGECEAAPLPSIASFVCPMSHSACKPVAASVIGERLDGPADIRRIGDRVRAESLDLLQADHTLSGIDMALWDLIGTARGRAGVAASWV